MVIPGKFSLGLRLQSAQDFNDATGLLAAMIVIFVIGVVMDALVFSNAERWVRKRYGFVDDAAAAR